jgi:hypothetical protein
MTKAIEQILPDGFPEEIEDTINHFKSSLDETVSFGTHVLKWDLEIKDKVRGDESVPPIMLLRHLLDLVDSIAILVAQGSADTAKILLRAAFECNMSLEYIFEKDTTQRSLAYMVTDLINQIKVLKKFNPDTIEGTTFNNVLNQETTLDMKSVAEKFDLQKLILEKESIFLKPHFVPIYEEYQRLKGATKIKRPSWHQFFDGPTNIISLAKYLKKEAMYELLYRQWSGAVHGSDVYLGKIGVGSVKGLVEVVQLRYFKDVQSVVSYAQHFIISSLRLYVTNRIPEKFPELQQWYLSNRNRFGVANGKQLIITE